jgi:hypothetical protein
MDNSDNTVATHYWRHLDNDHVVCTLCPRECELREGKRGVVIKIAGHGNKKRFTVRKMSGTVGD